MGAEATAPSLAWRGVRVWSLPCQPPWRLSGISQPHCYWTSAWKDGCTCLQTAAQDLNSHLGSSGPSHTGQHSSCNRSRQRLRVDKKYMKMYIDASVNRMAFWVQYSLRLTITHRHPARVQIHCKRWQQPASLCAHLVNVQCSAAGRSNRGIAFQCRDSEQKQHQRSPEDCILSDIS